jgi:hypothetical protein
MDVLYFLIQVQTLHMEHTQQYLLTYLLHGAESFLRS